MDDKKTMIGTLLLIASVLCAIGMCGKIVNASQLNIEDAKSAIVEVQSGLKSYDGKFYQAKSASGFVICNEYGSVYIVAANHSVNVTDSEKKKICKEHHLDSASGLNTEIRILVEGDVFSDVTVKASSEQEDFCILEAGDVLNKKTALHLLDEGEIDIGDPVYMLGFSAKSDIKSEYDSKNVEIHAGIVQDAVASTEGNTYIQHSAVVMAEQSGGALINEDGYLVGMGNSAIKNDSIGAYYALPISRIQVILDNYGIIYDSRKKDEAQLKLEKTYQECLNFVKSGKYNRESVERLEAVLQNVKETIGTENISLEQIQTMQNKLDENIGRLEQKVSKLRIVKYLLLPILVILLILTVRIFLQYRRMTEIY